MNPSPCPDRPHRAPAPRKAFPGGTRGLLIAGALGLLLGGCLGGGSSSGTSGDPDGDAAGSLELQVVDWQSRPVPGAEVSLDGQPASGNTDRRGSVVLDDLAPGAYVVRAVRKGLGTGRVTAVVKAGLVTRAELEIPAAAGIVPSVSLYAPVSGEMSIRDTLDIMVRLRPASLVDSGLSRTWSATRGGREVEGVLSGLTDTSCRFSAGETGQYTVVHTVRDRDEFSSSDSLRFTVRDYAPVVSLVSPLPGAESVPGDTVLFAARVSDFDGQAGDLAYSWSVTPGPAGAFLRLPASGDTVRWKSALPKGVQRVTLTATDLDGNAGSDEVEVRAVLPVPVEMLPASKAFNSVTVHWTPYAEDDFLLYQVYSIDPNRMPALRAEILRRDSTSWTDDSVQFGETRKYWIVVRNSAGRQSAGDTVSVEPGISIAIGSSVAKLLCDGRRPILYALDNPNSRLFVVDTGTRKAIDTLSLPAGPVDMSADSGWNLLYVANYRAGSVSVIDLETRDIVRTIPAGPEPYRVQALADGRFAYSEQDQWCAVVLVDGTTGAILDTIPRDVYRPALAASPSGKTLYAGESGISGGNIYRWDIVSDSFAFVEETPGYGYGYPERSLVISPDGGYLFYAGHKIAANNLASDLAQFGGTAYASDRDGRRAVLESLVAATDGSGKRVNLPLRTTVAAVAPDDSRLYLYAAESGRIYIADFTTLRP